MVITNTDYEDTYTGDNATTVFAVTIPLLAAADVKATLDGVANTDFTFTPGATVDGHIDGGSLEFDTAPATDVAIILYSDSSTTQDYVDAGATNTIDVEDVEQALDALTIKVRDATRRDDNYAEEAAASAVAAAASAAAAAADAISTAADVVSTNADVVSTNADAVSTAADAVSTAADAVSTAADAAAAAASAGSASAIAAGDTSPLANTSGNFAAVDGGLYWVDDGAQITLPAIGFNVGFHYLCKTQPPATGVTIVYDSANPINGNSSNQTVITPGFISVKAPTTSAWTVSKAMLQLLPASQGLSVKAKTGNYTLTLGDDLVVFTITAGATATLFAASTANEVVKIKNSASSTHPLTIDGNAAETIDGSANIVIYPGQGVQLQSDGTNWETL